MTDQDLTSEQQRLRKMAEDAKVRLAEAGNAALQRLAERNRQKRERGEIVS